MVSTGNMLPDDTRRQDVVAAENRLNRNAIADSIKQMVLIMISLGLPRNHRAATSVGPDSLTQGNRPGTRWV